MLISTASYYITPIMPISPIKPTTNNERNKENNKDKKDDTKHLFDDILQEEIEKLDIYTWKKTFFWTSFFIPNYLKNIQCKYLQ